MQIDRIIYPITTLGPGQRIAIWTVGCSKHCANCANKELWDRNNGKSISPEVLVGIINEVIDTHKVDGVTFTGGDPLEQFDELLEFVRLLSPLSSDILIYTGYTLSEAKQCISPEKWNEFIDMIAVMIDGPYIDKLNDNRCVLRGSSNQNIIYFNEKVKERYIPYLEEGRKIQNVYYENKLISVGIHNRESKEART